MILKLTLLMLIAWTASLLLRRSSAAVRHLMWTFTLAAGLLLPLAEILVIRAAAPQLTFRSTIAAGPALLRAPTQSKWIIAIYGLGVVWLLAGLLRDVIAANRLVRKSRASLLPNVRVSEQSLVPCAWGTIIVPSVFEEWPKERQSLVLAHEQAHLARHDRWSMLVARFACAVYWFHPLIWLAAAKLRMEADRACDDAVLREGFSGDGYAAALVHIARNLHANPPANLLAPGAVRASQLEERVHHILASGADRRGLNPIAIGSLLAACLGTSYGLAALTQQSARQIYNVGPEIRSPGLLKKVDPLYTKDARASKLSGTVLLSLVVGADGMGHDIRVSKKLDPGLDASAVRAIQQWKFRPGTKRGQPVDVRASIEVNFRLQ